MPVYLFSLSLTAHNCLVNSTATDHHKLVLECVQEVRARGTSSVGGAIKSATLVEVSLNIAYRNPVDGKLEHN